MELTKEQIDWLKECVTGTWTLENGVVDVVGKVNCSIQTIKKFPVKFGKVIGSFEAEWTMIETLEGAPQYVEGYFSVNGCPHLKSLESCPQRTKKIYFSGCRSLEKVGDLPETCEGAVFDNQNSLDKGLLELMNEQRKLLENFLIDWKTFRETVLRLENRDKLLKAKNLGLF